MSEKSLLERFVELARKQEREFCLYNFQGLLNEYDNQRNAIQETTEQRHARKLAAFRATYGGPHDDPVWNPVPLNVNLSGCVRETIPVRNGKWKTPVVITYTTPTRELRQWFTSTRQEIADFLARRNS